MASRKSVNESVVSSIKPKGKGKGRGKKQGSILITEQVKVYYNIMSSIIEQALTREHGGYIIGNFEVDVYEWSGAKTISIEPIKALDKDCEIAIDLMGFIPIKTTKGGTYYRKTYYSDKGKKKAEAPKLSCSKCQEDACSGCGLVVAR